MNIQPKPGDRVEAPESPREWGHWQPHVCPAISAPTAAPKAVPAKRCQASVLGLIVD